MRKAVGFLRIVLMLMGNNLGYGLGNELGKEDNFSTSCERAEGISLAGSFSTVPLHKERDFHEECEHPIDRPLTPALELFQSLEGLFESADCSESSLSCYSLEMPEICVRRLEQFFPRANDICGRIFNRESFDTHHTRMMFFRELGDFLGCKLLPDHQKIIDELSPNPPPVELNLSYIVIKNQLREWMREKESLLPIKRTFEFLKSLEVSNINFDDFQNQSVWDAFRFCVMSDFLEGIYGFFQKVIRWHGGRTKDLVDPIIDLPEGQRLTIEQYRSLLGHPRTQSFYSAVKEKVRTFFTGAQKNSKALQNFGKRRHLDPIRFPLKIQYNITETPNYAIFSNLTRILWKTREKEKAVEELRTFLTSPAFAEIKSRKIEIDRWTTDLFERLETITPELFKNLSWQPLHPVFWVIF